MDSPSALASLVEDFLTDLAQANRLVHTRRAYATDLGQFCDHYQGAIAGITADTLRGFFATLAHLSPAGRARKQAALASFLHWAYCQDLIAANPMDRVARVGLDPPKVRGLTRPQVEAILAVIPLSNSRDRLLFRLLFETGLRIGEALALHIEDLDLAQDDEHLWVLGKGNTRRTVLLDDSRLVVQLRLYIRKMGYRHGPLFRAAKNHQGGPLRYQSVQEHWAGYCAQAGIPCTLHQLRHTHATELVNEVVSLGTIRKRLGHKNLQTTLRYAEQTDTTADAELRAARRTRDQQKYGH